MCLTRPEDEPVVSADVRVGDDPRVNGGRGCVHGGSGDVDVSGTIVGTGRIDRHEGNGVDGDQGGKAKDEDKYALGHGWTSKSRTGS